MTDNERPAQKEKRRKLPPLDSLPEKWQKEYERIFPLAVKRYASQWGGVAECEYQIHLYVVNCWEHEEPDRVKPKPREEKLEAQGLLF